MNRNILYLFIVFVFFCLSCPSVQAQDDGEADPTDNAGLAVRYTFLTQAQAVRDQDLDLWGLITLPSINLAGQSHEQYDFFLVMLGQAQTDPEAFEAAHDPARIQDVVVLGDTAMLYYDDPSGRVVQFNYLWDENLDRWRLSEIW